MLEDTETIVTVIEPVGYCVQRLALGRTRVVQVGEKLASALHAVGKLTNIERKHHNLSPFLRLLQRLPYLGPIQLGIAQRRANVPVFEYPLHNLDPLTLRDEFAAPHIAQFGLVKLLPIGFTAFYGTD